MFLRMNIKIISASYLKLQDVEQFVGAGHVAVARRRGSPGASVERVS